MISCITFTIRIPQVLIKLNIKMLEYADGPRNCKYLFYKDKLSVTIITEKVRTKNVMRK